MDISWVWQSALDFTTSHLPYVSPFWWWVFMAIVATAASTGTAVLLNFYFPGTVVAKYARYLSGFQFIGSVVWLLGYRRGETDAEKHADAEKAREQRSTRND